MTISRASSFAAAWLFLVGLPFWNADAFSAHPLAVTTRGGASACFAVSKDHTSCNEDNESMKDTTTSRRSHLQHLATMTAAATLTAVLPANAEDTPMREEERKYIQESYSDFTKTKEGWLYREVKPGSGERASDGCRVVFDWSGYTIGYFGRPFQAKGGPQGGAFDKDLDYERTVIGSGKMIKGLELALKDMQPNGVRQVVIPYGDLSYPQGDEKHDRVGPKPATFSGERALNFVLDNPRLDRTLLFNIKVIRVDKPDGKGGFSRG